MLLDKEGMLDDAYREDFRAMVEDHFTIRERGPNNRAANSAMGCAYAAQLWPHSHMAKDWQAYAEAVWNDWYEPGDTYEPAYIGHDRLMIKIGQVLGKNEELKGEKLRQTYERYLGSISPNGHVVTPGDGVKFDSEAFHVVFRSIMEVCPTPEYLWGLKSTYLASGDKSDEDFYREYPQYKDMEVRQPAWKAKVLYRWPATYKTPDQLILCPQRKPNGPFASFWIWDSCNVLYHGGVSDTRGDLTHYEVDGKMLIADHGRFAWPGWNNTLIVSEPDAEYPFRGTVGLNAGRWYRGSSDMRDARVYLPSEDFPLHPTHMNPWLHNAMLEKRRPYGYMWGNPDGPAGKNDVLDLKEIRLEFALLPPGGESESKVFPVPESSWWLGSEDRNVCPSEGPVDILIRDLFVAGPKGEKTLIALEKITDRLTFSFMPPKKKGKEGSGPAGFDPQPIAGEDLKKVASIVTDPKTGKKALKLTTRFGRTVLQIAFDGVRLNLTKDYNRLGFWYKYVTPIENWVRTPIHIGINGSAIQANLWLDRQQGGIITDSKAAAKGEDTYGSVSYQSIWTYDTTWQRRMILTKEGILVVRDELTPGTSADGMVAGPVWHLLNAPNQGVLYANRWEDGSLWFDANKNGTTAEWFDAPSVHMPDALQKRRPGVTLPGENAMNLMIAFGPAPGRINGTQFQPKPLFYANDYAVYNQATLRAGRKEIFVSVLIPHAPELLPETIAESGGSGGLRVNTFEDGRSVVKIEVKHKIWERPPITVEMKPGDEWSVCRK